MDGSPAAYTTWFTAFAAVFSLYAHTVLGLPSSIITPLVALAIAGGLYLGTMLEVDRLHVGAGGGPWRLASIICAGLAIIAMAGSTVIGFFARGMSVQDWGLFAVQVGLPVLLLLNPRRLELIAALGAICAGFAIIDAVFNFLAAGHVIDLAVYSGRLDADGLRVRYPGLTGNTHAAGVIAMVGIFSLAMRLLRATPARKAIYAIAIAVLFGSMILIDARRYTGMAALGLIVILAPPARAFPAFLTATLVGGWAVVATFNNVFDPDDDLRSRLMVSGFHRALGHPTIGGGAAYIDPAAIKPGFEALSAAGITESGALDFAIAYGIPAAVLLIAACLFALAARRRLQSIPVVLLTMFTAELAFGNPLTGFLGAILFYASLLYLQQDESREETRRLASRPTQMAVSS